MHIPRNGLLKWVLKYFLTNTISIRTEITKRGFYIKVDITRGN